jgi:type III secretory pathway component EscR
MRTIICKNCHLKKEANYRLKHQEYCGEAECQQARKRDYQKKKMAQDAEYRQSQLNGVADWRQSQSFAQYMHDYRKSHQAYVDENRKKQRIRNQKRHNESVDSMIVKVPIWTLSFGMPKLDSIFEINQLHQRS